MNIKLQRKLIFLLILIFSFSIFGSSKAVYADTYSEHDTYYLDVSIDSQTVKYTYDVIQDSNKSSKSKERNTNYYWFGYFRDTGILSNYPTPKSIGTFSKGTDTLGYALAKAGDSKKFETDKEKLMYSFPAGSIVGSGKQADGPDEERAHAVGRDLTDSLNTVIKTIDILDGAYDIDTPEKLVEASLLLSGNYKDTIAINGTSGGFMKYTVENYCDIYYGTNKSNPVAYKDGVFYGYIVPKKAVIDTSKLEESLTGKDCISFIWAVEKGYMKYDGSTAKAKTSKELGNLTLTELNDNDDAVWITMFNVADTANYKYTLAYNNELVDTSKDGNFVEDLLGGIFRALVLGVQSLLGLDSIYDLVYNGGSSAADNGMMNAAWWSIMLKYHLIFQVVAWMLIGLAVAKILIELNFSTINPKLKMSIMEMLQKLFIVGFLLVLTIPIMKLLSDINNDVVAIFKTQAQQDADAFTVGNSLAQLFAYAGYFGILVSLNCVYIMRSIMIAILGATAPLFIVTMAFSKGQGLFSQWLKEVVANIFLQSVHAFTLAFLFEVLNKGGMLEQLVILFSLIPITDTFRSWIFSQSGSAANGIGQKLGGAIASTTKNVAKGVAGGALNAGSDTISRRFGLNTESSGGGASGRSGGGSKGGSSESGASSTAESLGAKMSATEGKEKAGNRLTNLGKAMKAGGNLMSSFDTMGDMMSQANAGDYGSMAKSGQQLAQNVSEATNSSLSAGYNAAHTKIHQAKAAKEAARNFEAEKGKYKAEGIDAEGLEELKRGDIKTARKTAKETAYNIRNNIGNYTQTARGNTGLNVPSSALETNNGKTTISQSWIDENKDKHPELSKYAGQGVQLSSSGKHAILDINQMESDYANNLRHNENNHGNENRNGSNHGNSGGQPIPEEKKVK